MLRESVLPACNWPSSQFIPGLKNQKLSFHPRCWTPTRVCAVTTPFHSLYESNGWSELSRRGITVGSCRINGLHFSDHLVLYLHISEEGLHHSLDRFSPEYDQSEIKINRI